ncbi:fork head transcription factor 1 [Aaosphaeria arxii CBS 175.79]|uniref:Fork head transcription factor 1 n=1 Tax=Aaosphaeria arxii CBS 175.79 TaxID=1450172 RepID=A0A6A5X7Z8_9PLEO|nr:fork head transcription factor 1 [Aaosphaeria arxii CBS 175.79]KAF2009165.1 fork head transcription factor 1 [Aaosphaeria arxii CBS 175.79]
MPPSSTRRSGLRTRQLPEPHQQSDADTPDSITTPSRKRRRLNGSDRAAAPAGVEDLPRTRITESVASQDSNATLPNGQEEEFPSDPIERQNMIIASLRTPRDYTPNAAVDYANDLQARRNEGRNIAAFAKIAARDWCFFVQKTVLLIGRADARLRPNPPTSSQDPGQDEADDPVAQWGVDIDLGPNRQVSRVHAQIDFDSTEQQWFITVNSRNGLKLDDRSIEKGTRAMLHSGICIGLLGTQMLFLLANQEDRFHPMLWRQVKSGPDMDAESEKEGHPPSRSLPHAHQGGPTPKRENYDPFPPLSHPRNRQTAKGFDSSLLTSTPGRTQPDTPLAIRSSEKDPRSKGSPFYQRGMMLDGIDDIDYSADSARDIKPPHSYAQLIGQAILSSPEEMLTLANIYQHIKDRYAFFRFTNGGWQNSIRHNLSLSKSFEKVARRTDEPGKGMKWKIVDSEREDFLKKQIFHPRKGGGPVRLDSSGPNSPAMRDPPSQATERLVGVLGQTHSDIFGRQDPRPPRVKTQARSTTPPLTSYPMANESYTPDRGPRPQNPFGGLKQSPTHHDAPKFATPAKRLFQDAHGPGASYHQMSDREHGQAPSSPNVDPSKHSVSGLRDRSAHSPPTLYSDSTAINANGGMGGLITPLVARHAPRLAPPSTVHVPSQYLQLSSPAPFWKYFDIESTPAKAPPLDLSPTKMKKEDDSEHGEDEPVQPSSPPVLPDEANSREGGDQEENENGNDNDDENDNDNDKDEDLAPESPTRTLSRPVSRAHLPAPHHSRSNSNVNSLAPSAMAGGMVRGASLGSFEEVDEEGGFDLAKGFQKIGSFHRNMQAHGAMGPQSQDARRSVSTNM